MKGGRTNGTIKSSEQARRIATGNGRRQRAAAAGLPPPLSPAECQTLCRAASRPAIAALVAALDRPGERVAAAKVILDRAYGAATQRLEHGGAPDGSPILAILSMTEEQRMTRLRELLAKMRAGKQPEAQATEDAHAQPLSPPEGC